jgi:hypothetical protein
MIVVKTLEEAKAATAGFNTVHFPFQKKNFMQELHEGHVYTINEGRNFGNKTIISFWHSGAINNFLYPENFIFNKETELSWDENACVSWAEQQNIDIVWTSDYDDSISMVNVPDIEYYKNLINRIWKNENYSRLFDIGSFPEVVVKISCITRMLSNTGWKYILSTKDGLMRYVHTHFTNKYTNSRMALIKPIKSPEGIYYSSSYYKYTAKEKEIIARIEPTILAFDLTQDLGILKDNIDVFGKEIDLNITRLQKYVDAEIIGPKKLVEIYFSVGVGENIKHDHFAILIN